MPISFWQNSILSVDYKKDSIDLRHCTISKSGAENWIVVCSSLHQTLRLQGRVSFFPKNTARQEFQEKIHFISNGWLHLSFRLIQMNAGPLQKKTTLLQLFEENDHESLAIVLMAKWHHSALQWFFLFLFDSICSFFMHLYKHIWLDECTLTWFLFHHVRLKQIKSGWHDVIFAIREKTLAFQHAILEAYDLELEIVVFLFHMSIRRKFELMMVVGTFPSKMMTKLQKIVSQIDIILSDFFF